MQRAIPGLSPRSSIRNAMAWCLRYSLHAVTLLQHVKLPSLFHGKINLATPAGLLEECILRKKSSCPDPRILPVRHPTVPFVILFLIVSAWWPFISFNCVSLRLWPLCLVYFALSLPNLWTFHPRMHPKGKRLRWWDVPRHHVGCCKHLLLNILIRWKCIFKESPASQFLITHGG